MFFRSREYLLPRTSKCLIQVAEVFAGFAGACRRGCGGSWLAWLACWLLVSRVLPLQVMEVPNSEFTIARCFGQQNSAVFTLSCSRPFFVKLVFVHLSNFPPIDSILVNRLFKLVSIHLGSIPIQTAISVVQVAGWACVWIFAMF